MNKRPLHEIARDIKKHWKNVNYAALPYLRAMLTLECINDSAGLESGDSIVRYFLHNAQTWRGENARRIKAELNHMLDCIKLKSKL